MPHPFPRDIATCQRLEFYRSGTQTDQLIEFHQKSWMQRLFCPGEMLAGLETIVDVYVYM